MSVEPMIEVEGLTKRFAGHTAIDHLTFTVGRGEIVGLLGENGAGKSTTMRILTCSLPATSGTARVAGLDVFRDSREVRRRIGFMPENNPLHTDMRVRDYLKFRSRIKGLSRTLARERIDRVMQQCGLTDVGKRIIGQLSKGYRQRVGLADALMHDPQLIVLDEPTIGLDPIQIRSVRKLIKELGGHHTVLISTHILSEAEKICNRVLILCGGRIVAADTPENLQKGVSFDGQVVAEIAAPVEELGAAWEDVAEVQYCDLSVIDGDYVRCRLTPAPGCDLRPQIYEMVSARGWRLRELTRSRVSLEDIYLQVTRRDSEEER
jgi:ABC-2 type transport system ATP-binding protein